MKTICVTEEFLQPVAESVYSTLYSPEDVTLYVRAVAPTIALFELNH